MNSHGLRPTDFKTLGEWYGEGDLNPHDLSDLWILSPVRLPIPPSPHGHPVTDWSQCRSHISPTLEGIKTNIEIIRGQVAVSHGHGYG